jgi:hypothetical protein
MAICDEDRDEARATSRKATPEKVAKEGLEASRHEGNGF